MSSPRRTLVLADVHLARHTPGGLAHDLARLLGAHRGARVIFAGDLFDFSVDAPARDRRVAIAETLDALPAARIALSEHLDRGGELWLIGGNHDAHVADLAVQGALVRALGVRGAAAARLRTSPWFVREGGLHVEHGHLYDPDNAPAHPLVIGARSLGVHFTEELIAPTGAHRYLNANDGTPLGLFLSAFTWYGARGPYVVYRYFHTAFAALARSGPFYRAHRELEVGAERAPAFAEAQGVSVELLESLLPLGPRPTLESLAATFSRLYLDRVAATVAMAAGAGAFAAGARRAGAAALGLGAIAMGASWALEHDRYTGAVCSALERGASLVADATGAKLVVFGHTHREAQQDRYVNTGSFAFPRGAVGRPYVLVEGPPEAPRPVRRYLEPGSATRAATGG